MTAKETRQRVLDLFSAIDDCILNVDDTDIRDQAIDLLNARYPKSFRPSQRISRVAGVAVAAPKET